jgi:large subunit ribosomal protein L18
MASKLHLQDKARRRERRQYAISKKVQGTADRPRLVYAQLVDDSQGFTLAAASTKGLSGAKKSDLAKQTGKALAEAAISKGITSVVFDRNGYLYHGRVKALAEGAREGGLAF